MTEYPIQIHADPTGRIRCEVSRGEEVLSWVVSVPHQIRVGAATVPIAYVGPVKTIEVERGRGLARRALLTSLEAQRRAGAALSLLHGIDDFYPQFGYVQAGPDQYIQLRQLDRPVLFPDGWSVRPFVAADLPACQYLHARMTASVIGAIVRPQDGATWQLLAATAADTSADRCRVVVDAAGVIGGYAWRGSRLWYVRLCEEYGPDDLVIGEVIAVNVVAADALLAACQVWAVEEGVKRGRAITQVTLPTPHLGPIAEAALFQDATLLSNYFRNGSFVVRLLALDRLLIALAPEFTIRLRALSPAFVGTIRIRTERGEATLIVDAAGDVHMGATPLGGEEVTIALPEGALARLALGGFPPAAVLARLDRPLTARPEALCACLFPHRQTHIFAADRGVE